MKTDRNRNQLSLELLVVFSSVALCSIVLIAVFPPTTEKRIYIEKLLIGTIFAAICVGGEIASLFPRKCVSTSKAHAYPANSGIRNEQDLAVRGHHFDCGRFSTHTIQSGGRVYCAACTGLFAGTLAALAVSVIYFFFGMSVSVFSIPMIVFGEFSIVTGLFEYRLKHWLRTFANFLFVVGGSLIIIGADAYIHSLFIDLFVIGSILLWIITRIAISRWEHTRICVSCGFSCTKKVEMVV